MARRTFVAPLLGIQEQAEWSRLERAFTLSEADRVVCFVLPPDLEEHASVRAHVYERLDFLKQRNPSFGWSKKPVNLYSIEDTLRAYAEVFAEHEGDEVTVSLGAQGIAATASTIACLLWRKRGLFAPPPGAGPQDPQRIPDWIRLEKLLPDDSLRLLGIVVGEESGLDKRTIIERLKERGRIRPGQDKHAYRRLTTDFLPRLKELGFVEIGPRDDWDRRHQFVRATESGRQAYRILSVGMIEPVATLHLRGGFSRPSKQDVSRTPAKASA